MIEVDAKGEILELKVGPSVTLVEYSLTPNLVHGQPNDNSITSFGY
jgi:hypothetical protein